MTAEAGYLQDTASILRRKEAEKELKHGLRGFEKPGRSFTRVTARMGEDFRIIRVICVIRGWNLSFEFGGHPPSHRYGATSRPPLQWPQSKSVSSLKAKAISHR
jgi:hypothetical protein